MYFFILVVIYISAKPISMGIEARRNIKNTFKNDDRRKEKIIDENHEFKILENKKIKISDEIIKIK